MTKEKEDINKPVDKGPLESLHLLQIEEYNSYQQFKEKYTKELITPDLPADKKEILLNSIDAIAREYSVSDYEKLKFDKVLSPTERYLWTSLFKYIHDYNITFDDFKAIIETYSMPRPDNVTLEDAFKNLPEHRWLKVQDVNGKSMYGPYEELGSQLDFSLIRYLQIQDKLFSELRQYFDNYQLDYHFVELGANLRDNLIITNCSFFQFIAKIFLQVTGDVPDNIKTYCNPDGVAFYHSDVFMSFVQIVTFYGLKNKEGSPVDVKLLLDGVYSTFKIMQGYCAFVSLCSSLLIATLSDEKYQDSLLDMMCFFLLNFHNAYIFRIEIPQTPLNEKVSIENRGSEDHTTRMKIYLYDTKRIPYVVRVDMPHKGDGDENKLHFNVETIEGESVLNHKVIDCGSSNPSDLLNVMIDNMTRMSIGILNIKDSYKEDDKRMLELMQAFNAYDDMSMAFFQRKDNPTAVTEFNARVGTDCKTVEEGMQEGFMFFSTM